MPFSVDFTVVSADSTAVRVTVRVTKKSHHTAVRAVRPARYARSPGARYSDSKRSAFIFVEGGNC